ncbi:hypothetical protein [Acrocarpospora catenulata]|uniref:hypothetical protein n=1 Tax=Acrocarpospora catenulata TaxID=2836182 RepID=UPI001BDA49D2|nr:hypothetical protein [Acrocarpospora catenulata]
MRSGLKLGAFGGGLAVLFGGALWVGALAAPDTTPPKTAGHEAGGHEAGGHGEGAHSAAPAKAPGGLQVAEQGISLVPESATLDPGEKTDFRFSVLGPDGRPITGYRTEHEKKLHFIVVSRDLGHFQHLHPELGGDGRWSVPLDLPAAGTYRAFADFAPDSGPAMTLGVDLFAPGEYRPTLTTTPSRTATVDGYTVSLTGDLVPGSAGSLTVSVAKDGRPVTDLEPYLGAYGHLVALRGGDLAYLHVHPEASAAGPEITFHTEVPSRGDYRLFLDFKHAGTVRTADFTVRANETTESGHGHSH